MDLSYNPLTGQGALLIVQALQFNDTLEELWLPKCSNKVTIEVLKFWTKIDERRASLTKPSLVIQYSS